MGVVIQNKNKQGQLISARIKIWAKDQHGNNKLYAATIKRLGLPKKDFDTLVAKKQLLFAEGLEKGFYSLREYELFLNGIAEEENEVKKRQKKRGKTFNELANQIAQNILEFQSKAYYKRFIETITLFSPIFGDMELRSFTRKYLKDELRKCQSRRAKVTHYKLIPDIKILLAKNKLTKDDLCVRAGISHQTYDKLRNKQRVKIGTAESVCKVIGLDFSKDIELEVIEGKPLATATISGYRRILSRVFSEAVEEEIIEVNPMTGLKIAKDETVKKISKDKVLNLTEVKALEDYVVNIKDRVKRIALLIPIHTGLRVGEVNGLRWSAIDLVNKKIHVKRARQYISGFGTFEKGTKTEDSERVIAISERLCEQLASFKEWWDYQRQNVWGDNCTSDILLLNWIGKPYAVGQPRNWLEAVLKECGLKHISYHNLRHTNISIQIMSGVPITTVAHRAGHKDSNVTLKVYSHFIEEDDIKAAATIDNLFGKK